MDQQVLNFDLAEAERLKEDGIIQAQEAFSRRNLIEAAKAIAIEVAGAKGTVTADDVFLEMTARGLQPELLGNAAGSLFRGKDFEFTGEWRKSQRVSNHAHQNRVWRLREGE